MSINITIRDVPEDVKQELAARAALEGKSMQEYLRAELVRLAAAPPLGAWVNQVREHKAVYGSPLTAKEILEARDADRR